MKLSALIFSLFLSLSIFANNEKSLAVEQDGLVVEVMDFEEGDKIKLFEVESGDHILSKSYGRIDLSQLPLGSYLLENNQGQSVIIDRLEESLMIDGAIIAESPEFLLEEENIQENYIAEEVAEDVVIEEEIDVEQEFVEQYVNSNKNLLSIEREGNMITVINFEEGDKLKLFEVKDTIHVLSKTTNIVDLSQLPVGVYVLENSKGDSVIIEKFTEIQNNLTEL